MRRFSSHNARLNEPKEILMSDSSGAVGKGVQPPDGTTEPVAFIRAEELATLRSCKYAATVALYLTRSEESEVALFAEPSMSTTSPSADRDALEDSSGAGGEAVPRPGGQAEALEEIRRIARRDYNLRDYDRAMRAIDKLASDALG